jgi:hypothetical protein
MSAYALACGPVVTFCPANPLRLAADLRLSVVPLEDHDGASHEQGDPGQQRQQGNQSLSRVHRSVLRTCLVASPSSFVATAAVHRSQKSAPTRQKSVILRDFRPSQRTTDVEDERPRRAAAAVAEACPVVGPMTPKRGHGSSKNEHRD